MIRTTIPGLLALTAAAVGLATTESAPPIPGPGGVYHAVVDLCAALDRGDTDYLREAFVASRHGIEFYRDDDGELATREPAGAFEFADELATGAPVAVRTLAALEKAVAGFADAELGPAETEIETVYADCPSGHCSYAVVEFDRVWGEGEDRRVVPMRATALVRYDGSSTPHFRVFHWHAARR